MLKATVSSEPDLTTVKLEGKLASAWVLEAAKCAEEIVSTVRAANVAVDLTAVTFVDQAGKSLLTALAKAGVRLISDDPVMDAIVNDVAAQNMAQRVSVKAEMACSRG
jgi:ABC-type transporter Mla MlaB component